MIPLSRHAYALELGYLLPSSAPPRWKPSLLYAGKILAKHMKSGGSQSDLATLALVIFTMAGEQGTEPQHLALPEIRAALQAGTDAEHSALRSRIGDQAEQASDERGARSTGLRRLVRELSAIPGEDSIAHEYGDFRWSPPELHKAMDRLVPVLDRLSARRVARLPDPPAPVGPVRIEADKVSLIGEFSSLFGPSSPRCERCGLDADPEEARRIRVVAVDGEDVWLECPAGHVSFVDTPTARQVRSALALQRRDPAAARSEGRLQIDGELCIDSVHRIHWPPDEDRRRPLSRLTARIGAGGSRGLWRWPIGKKSERDSTSEAAR
ncbi:hypothetical protein [Streptomyces phytophilus]|uniref:hypothetical protein n=1 Tax=Streptomyces phytophilus TaxID=722715 RepID=UPI0015F06ABC|nr:hypothetical protein [Streptomyces phytophilus]